MRNERVWYGSRRRVGVVGGVVGKAVSVFVSWITVVTFDPVKGKWLWAMEGVVAEVKKVRSVGFAEVFTREE